LPRGKESFISITGIYCMRFSTFIFRNVFRRPVRSTLTITGMAVAVTAVVALVGLSNGFQRSMLQQYVDRGISLIVTRNEASVAAATMPEKVASDIKGLPGVVETCPGLLSFNPIDELGSDPMIIQGWAEGNYMFTQLKPVEGEILSAKNHGQKAVVVGDELARLKSIKIGSTLSIGGDGDKYQVVGIFKSSADMESTMVIMFLTDAQQAFGHAHQITGCTVKLKDNGSENVQRVANAIETRIADENALKGKLRAKAPMDFIRQNNMMSFAQGFAWAVSIIALVIGGIGVLNTMFMSVFERTREIGILRAIGWRPRRVMKMILLESVALSIGAGIVGTLLGLGAISLFGLVPVLAGAVHAAISPDIIIKGFLIAVLVGVIGAAYPAYRGSRLLPTEALRHE
jgi:putative ABC transport system permease protein